MYNDAQKENMLMTEEEWHSSYSLWENRRSYFKLIHNCNKIMVSCKCLARIQHLVNVEKALRQSWIIPLPDDKSFCWSKLKAFADEKINVT